jgi:hypothetical protein
MSDTLYLSLWYPNLRLEALPDKLTAVLGAFAAHGGEAKVYAATVWPMSWNETPVFQQIYGRAGSGEERGAEPRQAVEEALELLHEDDAYEFQIGWSLWEIETGGGASAGVEATAGPSTRQPLADSLRMTSQKDARDDKSKGLSGFAQDDSPLGGLDPRWVREPRLVRVTGFGPLFDEGTYEQDGHIRVDFGTDTPFLEEDAELDAVGARHIEQNVRQLVELTQAVERESGATARLLWSELGESLAQRLAARLGVRN